MLRPESVHQSVTAHGNIICRRLLLFSLAIHLRLWNAALLLPRVRRLKVYGVVVATIDYTAQVPRWAHRYRLEPGPPCPPGHVT
jgi:hypothetical protein